MANPSNDHGQPIDHLTSEPLQAQNLKPKKEWISLLRIGQYQIRWSRRETHLTAKWYYGRKKLNWEILQDRLRKKIEIDWSNIAAIRVDHRGDLKILEIELYEPPNFYRELKEHARTMMPISDFTGGQASTYRVHHLEFADDTHLEKNMRPLFSLDSRLKESTERHFPTLGSPFFVDLELRLGHSPRYEMNQVDTGRHSGLASSSNPHRDLALGLPSSSSLTTSDFAGRPPDGEQHDNRNTEQLVMMKSNEPHTNDVDDPDSHYGPTGAELVSNPHQD